MPTTPRGGPRRRGKKPPPPGSIAADEPWVRLVAQMCRRPGMYLGAERYREAAAFLDGALTGFLLAGDQQGKDGLHGFVLWIESRYARPETGDSPYPWSWCVRKEVEPETSCWEEPANPRAALAHLLELLAEYTGHPAEEILRPGSP